MFGAFVCGQPLSLPSPHGLLSRREYQVDSRCSQLRVSPLRSPSLRFVAMDATADNPRKNKNRRRRSDPTRQRSVPEKTKLEPEEVFYDGRSSWTELIVPTLAILTVVGIIPFAAAVARYIWVRYKITSRRIAVDSGFRGKDHIEIVYRDIQSIKYVRRAGGSSADCVLSLRDGAKLELRAVPEWDRVYEYILAKVGDDTKSSSGAA